MQIYIKHLNGKTMTLDVESSDSIEVVKQKIYKKYNIPSDQQRLVFKNRELNDNEKLSETKIENNSIIYITLKLGTGGRSVYNIMNKINNNNIN